MTQSKSNQLNGTRYSSSSSWIRWGFRFYIMEFIFKSRFCSKICNNFINFSSIFSWALIFDKFKLLNQINKSTEDFEKKFWKAKSAESFNNNLPNNSKDPATLNF